MRGQVEGDFRSALALVPGLQEAVATGNRVGRFVGTGDLPNFWRTSAGPGWALVGDAGHHKDPCTGMGMSDAFLAAEMLAGAVHDGLVGHRPMDDALADYQEGRDDLTANGFELTLRTAQLAPPSARLERVYRQAEGRPDVIRSIFGVLGGSIPTRDLYAGGH